MKRPPRCPKKDKLVNERYWISDCGKGFEFALISWMVGMAIVRVRLRVVITKQTKIPQSTGKLIIHEITFPACVCVFYVLCARVRERKCWDGWLCAKQLGKKWCRRRTTGQVSVGAWLRPLVLPPLAMLIRNDICSLPLLGCPQYQWLATSAADTTAARQKEKSRTDTPGRFLYSLFVHCGRITHT